MTNSSPLGAIRRRWWIIVLMAIIGAIFGALPEPEKVEEQVRTFSATHTMLLNNELSNQVSTSAISPEQVSLFATTGEVPARVVDVIGYGGNPASLASQVTSEFDFSNGALTISTTGEDPAQAELVADTFADELNSYLAERQDEIYQERLAASQTRLAELETDLTDLTLELAFSPDNPVIGAQQNAVARQYSVAFEHDELLGTNPPLLGFTTLQTAQAVETTDRGLGAPTSRSSRALLGALVGAALGVGVALLLGQLDRRLRTRDQAEDVMEMRARVMIPKVRDNDRDQLVVATGRHDPLSDSYRTVRNVVGFVQGPADQTNRAKITLVVSPGPGDGKTSLAVNIAAAMAESGQRTVLVNTDFRRPRMVSALGAQAEVPLPFMLEDLDKLDAKTLLNKTDRSRLLVMDLSTIEGSAGELVRATVEKLPALSQLADSIVIDSSPVGVTAEVLELVPHADVIVVIARVGHTQISAAQRAIAILRDLATAPMILVLGGVKMEKAQYYEYTDRRNGRNGPDDRKGRSKWWRRTAKTEPERELEPVE
jgi:Mrp family chromosome partitioning ATPase